MGIENEALKAKEKYQSAVESASDYIEHFDLLETITNVGNDEVFTPRKTVAMMLDSLPEEVWHNKDYKWLNPATKNGIFEREIALRLDEGLKDVILDEETRRKHILQNMIYAIGQTKFTANVARRTLYYCSDANRKCDGIKAEDGHYVNGYAIGNGTWFDTIEGNIFTPKIEHYFDKKGKCTFCGIDKNSAYNDKKQREHYAYEFIHYKRSDLIYKFWNTFFKGDRSMKFDIIIGNPPYQLTDGGNGASAMPIYQKFIEQAIDLYPKYLSMIVPSRWFAGGRGLDQFRNRILHDERLRKIYDFPDASECFPGVEIKGGVCYFIWNRDEKGLCEVSGKANGVRTVSNRPLLEKNSDTFIRYNEAISILHKVNQKKENTFMDFVSANDPFGYDVRVENSYVRIKPEIKNEQFNNSIPIYYFGWKKKGIGYIDKSTVRKNSDWIDSKKIFISRAYGAGEKFPHQILGCPFIADEGTVCTETYLMVGPFKDDETVKNVLSYMKTKMFRFLVMLKKNTQSATPSVYEFVPMQNFNEDWSDEKLFSKYGITNDEINFINQMIKPMDDESSDDDE